MKHQSLLIKNVQIAIDINREWNKVFQNEASQIF